LFAEMLQPAPDADISDPLPFHFPPRAASATDTD
jgi:hypothetical protein